MEGLIINGIIYGCLYALSAMGLVLIFKVCQVVNFAQGEMAMFLAFIIFAFLNMKFHYGIAIVLTIIISVLIGLIIERAIMRPIGGAHLSAMIATLGLIMIFNGMAGFLFGTEEHKFPSITDGTTIGNQAMIIGVTVVIMLILFCFFKFTKTGLGVRAVSQDHFTSRLMGVSVKRVTSITWALAAVLACVTGMLVASQTTLTITMMQEIHLKAFCSAVLGGFNSFLGPVVGGVILGVSENLFGSISVSLIKWKSVFSFGLIIIMLIIKPNGIMGTKYRKKV